MSRLLFIIVLLAVSLIVIKSIRSKIRRNESANNELDNNATSHKKMLKCQHCGLHIPEDEAIRQGDRVFCSLDHARQQLE